MPLESATTIDQLDATNPAHTDGLGAADSHLRLLKSALKATFPGVVGATTATAADLNNLHSGLTKAADGSSGAPSIGYSADATVGFYRSSTGHQVGVGRTTGNGFVPPSFMGWFPIDPGASVVARGGTAAGNEPFVECDGSTYAISKFPDLFTIIGATFGGDGTTTFGVPNLKDQGRYIRSRTSTLAVATYQAADTAPHTHSAGTLVTASAGLHNHDTGGLDPSTHNGTSFASATGLSLTLGGLNTATVTIDDAGQTATAGGGGTFTAQQAGAGKQAIVGLADPQHTHFIKSDGTHTHSITGATASSSGTETRPVSFVGLSVMKT